MEIDMGFKKICTHCGKYTHSQPQDYNHDKGYGHCYECLHDQNWYEKTELKSGEYRLLIFDECPACNDDSHAKVYELIRDKKVIIHMTCYSPKPVIIGRINSKYCINL